MADFINADVDIGKFNTIIDIMKQKAVQTKPAMAAIGNLVVKSVKQNFRVGGRPDKWTPSKKTKGKTLVATGSLEKGIHYEIGSDEGSVTIMTTPLKYARIMQNGGKIGPHTIVAKNRQALKFSLGGVTLYRTSVNHPGSNIPARPYMLLQDEDEAKIKDILYRHFTDSLSKEVAK